MFKIPDRKSIVEMEDEVSKFWKSKNVFKKSIEQRPEDRKFVFVDGPPFVSGNPHYATLLPSIAKDVIPRYFSMKGNRVRRVWGWDCHGLPIEEKVNQKFNIKTKKDLQEKLGTEKYVKECRDFVLSCISNWGWYIEKIGRWVDLENAYYTMNPEFNESVVWAFSEIYKKGLIYKGKRVSLYSTDTGTPVSDFEVAMDPDNYRDTEDISIFPKFEIKSQKFLSKYKIDKAYLLAWTTTPWTIPSNFALCINPDFEYVLVMHKNEHYVISKSRVNFAFNDDFKILKTLLFEDLLNLEYIPIYDFYKTSNKNDFKVYESKDVTNEEGTGILHVAPAFGEVDFELGKKYGLSSNSSIDDEGFMLVGDFAGTYLRDANEKIANELFEKKQVLRVAKYLHRLPYYRGKNPLIYKVQDAYFIRLKKVNEDILKLNEKVNWIPKHFKKGRFAKTVEASPDWCISRNRYWATIMPLWVSEDEKKQIVIGSIEELSKYCPDLILKENNGKKLYYFKDEPFRFHRDICDRVVFEFEGKKYHRVSEVLDGWLDSGSVPFAEYHFPFENKSVFESSFPADFIVEYTGQIRAWFQVLFRVSSILFNKAPYKNVLVTGVLAGTDGRKMSKSFGNYPDPKKVLETIGGDALRLYFMSSPIMLGENVSFEEVALQNKVKSVLNIFWNSTLYFLTYAEKFEFEPQENFILENTKNILDKWLLESLSRLSIDFSKNLESYNIPKAVKILETFIDDLSTWYIRRSRDRISNNDKDALNTFYFALLTLSKISAPIIPFMSESVFQLIRLEKNKESVHLEDYPDLQIMGNESQTNLINDMQLVRDICSLGNSLRKEINIPIRQPLQALYVVGDSMQEDLVNLIKDELNVKSVVFVKSKNEVLKNSNFFSKEDKIFLDTTITPELKLEGNYRSLVRLLMDLRKEKGLKVGEKVKFTIEDTPDNKEILNSFEKDLKERLDATDIELGRATLIS